MDSGEEGAKNEFFIGFGVLSMLILPLFFEHEFWGCISFDDRERRRIFSKAEIEYMTAAGALLMNAIARNELTLNLISAKETALAGTRAKSAFLANMSHELRTPLSAIIGMSAVARNSRDDSKKIDFCLEKIVNYSKLLLGLINDILDISKIESQRFELSSSKFSFRAVLRDICDINEDEARNKRLKLTLEIDDNVPEAMIGDDLRISQVVNNLISNAIKFTPCGGIIAVKASELERDDKTSALLLSVTDSGIGIEPDKLECIFNTFEQLHSGVTRSYSGSGLGLSISKSLVGHMNGEIWAESTPGIGSKFSFTVRLERAANTDEQDAGENAPDDFDFSGKVFLLAEDIDINRIIVEELLSPCGAAIEYAQNGLEALNMFTANPTRYDIILMDMQMPVMCGLEATEKIRASGTVRSAAVPIIAMTANAFSEDVERCLQSGMNGHISKPLDAEKLLAYINSFL